MKVLFTPFLNINKNENTHTTKPSLKYQYGLAQDVVSFGAIKKSKLNNYQLLCANYFKAPLEKFNTKEEFKTWTKNELKETINPQKYPCYNDFPPYEINESNTKERTKRLEEWKQYLLNDKEMKAHPELALYIADSITRDLYPETKNFPPLFDKTAMQSTIQEIDDILNLNPKASISFKKKYQDILRTNILKIAEKIEDPTTDNKNNYWVRVPSLSNDPENFDQNIKILNVLSAEGWCTKGHFAQEYMQKGDFYIYMENTSPELSVRLEGNMIKEVRDRNHDSKIPLSYFEPLSTLIEEQRLNGYELDLQALEYRKGIVNLAKSFIQDDIDSKNYINILKLAGIDAKYGDDGLLELSNFKKPHSDYTFQDLGINENEMFKSIGVIDGYADFGGTQVTNLGKLKTINGNVSLEYSKLSDIGNVEVKGRIFRE